MFLLFSDVRMKGTVDIDTVIRVSETLFEMGIDELSLGDTIGVANPKQVQEVVGSFIKKISGR